MRPPSSNQRNRGEARDATGVRGRVVRLKVGFRPAEIPTGRRAKNSSDRERGVKVSQTAEGAGEGSELDVLEVGELVEGTEPAGDVGQRQLAQPIEPEPLDAEGRH